MRWKSAILAVATFALAAWAQDSSQAPRPPSPEVTSVKSLTPEYKGITPEMVAARAANIPSRKYPELKGVLRNERIVLPALDAERLRAEDAQKMKRGDRKIRLGLNVPAGYTPATHGKWIELGDASVAPDQPKPKAYAFGITARNAEGMRLHFTNFSLPAGAKMYVYAAENDKNNFIYEGKGPQGTGEFWTPIIFGDAANIEISGIKAETASFAISEVAQLYQDPFKSYDYASPAGACNKDVSCYTPWDSSSKAVGIVVFNKTDGTYLCSGVMLNNASGDSAPFFGTASHCISQDYEAGSSSFYFGFRTSACNGPRPSGAAINPANGAQLLATTGEDAIDSTLLLITDALPAGVNLSGWNKTDPAQGAAITGIHHPHGDYQRISFGATVATDVNFPSFHRVRWSPNLGVTEPGSSGSPLFNSSGEVLGFLSGGFSSCSNQQGPDYYGRLSQAYPYFVAQDGQNYLQVGLPDDRFEPNDSRDTATQVVDMLTGLDLIAKAGDEDWYHIHVPANHVFSATFGENNASDAMATIEIYEDGAATATWSGSRFFAIEIPTRLLEHDYDVRVRTTDARRRFYNLGLISRDVDAPALYLNTTSLGLDHFTVYGGINPQYIPVDLWVEWGVGNDPALYQKSPVTRYDPSLGGPGWPFSYQITGLIPGDEYSFRSAADNGFKHSFGPIVKVRTFGADSLQLSKDAIDLGTVPLLQATTGSVQLSNPGPGPVKIRSLNAYTLSGLYGAPQLTHDCPQVIAPLQTCTLSATVIPFVASTQPYIAARITVDSETTTNLVSTDIKLLGYGPLLVLGKFPTYSNVQIKTTLVDSLAVMNKGSAPMPLLRWQVMSGSFLSIQNKNCPATLPPGTGCLINLLITPQNVGGFGTEVRLYSTDDYYQAFNVYGQAVDLSLVLNRPHRPTRSSAADIISASQAMRASVVVSASGYSGPVSLSCGNVPANLTCDLAQNSVNLSADGTPAFIAVAIGVRGAGRLTPALSGSRASRLNAPSAIQRTRSATVTINATAGGAVRSVQVPVQYVQ